MVRMTRPSRRHVAMLSAALGMVALAGCAGPVVSAIAPPPYRDEAAAGYDATWRALVRALAGENVPLRVVAKDSGVISTDDFISPIGVYADCGRMGEVQLEGEAMGSFTLFVVPSIYVLVARTRSVEARVGEGVFEPGRAVGEATA